MSFFSQLCFIVREMKAMGYERKAIANLTPVVRPKPIPISKVELKEIKERLINAGASQKVVQNVEKIYEG